jgi:hypothetical protein
LQEHGIEASIVSGEKSQFDVFADGRLVFSKQLEGRYPEAVDVRDRLKTADR